MEIRAALHISPTFRSTESAIERYDCLCFSAIEQILPNRGGNRPAFCNIVPSAVHCIRRAARLFLWGTVHSRVRSTSLPRNCLNYV